MVKLLFFYLQFFTAVWPRETDTVKMMFLGDIMQHESQLESALVKGGNRDSSSHYNYSHYFKYLTRRLQEADITGANIETTFAPPPFTGYPSFSSPESLLHECAKSGINLFFAANNHSADKGSRGLEGSVNLYKKTGIPYAGIYSGTEEAEHEHPLIIEEKGIKIAFLNYTYGTNGIKVSPPYVVNMMDTILVKRDLEKAKNKNPDFIISVMHWGREYKLKSSSHQRKWEKFLYDNGTDIIIGSHPHVPQEVEVYRDSSGTPCAVTAFSLGNAISNMSAKNTRIGIMLEIDLIKEKQTGRSRLEDPVIHWIWTSRPSATGGHYTIIPIADYISNPGKFNITGEKELIESYYYKFTNKKRENIE